MIPCIEPQPARIISSMVHLMPVLHDSHASSQSCILVQHGAVVSRGAALEGLGLFCMKPSTQVREMVILPTLQSRSVGCCSTVSPNDTALVLNARAATVTSPVMCGQNLVCAAQGPQNGLLHSRLA